MTDHIDSGGKLLSDFWVYIPIWTSMTAWFIGAVFRQLATSQSVDSQPDPKTHLPDEPMNGGKTVPHRSTVQIRSFHEVIYRYSWLMGAILLSIHILASYGFVHHWSHRAVLESTAAESFRVTGYRAAWGVYVNFAFLVVWLAYSLAMIYRGARLRRLDPMVLAILTPIVFSATVVFETGIVRTVSITGFLLLIGLTFLPRCIRSV